MGNIKYKQTIMQDGFTEDILKALTERGFTPSMIDKHIRPVRNRFSFNIGTAKTRRSEHSPPKTLPDIVFIETSRKTATTTGSATPTKPSQSISTLLTDTGMKTTTTEQTIETMVLMGQGTSSEEQELPIISEVYSMSTMGGTAEGERETSILEYVSEIPRELEIYDPKETLSAIDLHVKREMIDDDVHPGDSEFYPRMQRVYQNV